MFITFEGIDGSGKTTVIRKVADSIKEKGIDVVVTKEPGGTKLGKKIRELTEGEATQLAKLYLYLADRAEHIKTVINPALLQGKVVLCDRYSASTIAYQGIGNRLGRTYVTHLCEGVEGFVTPDTTFLLDLTPNIAAKRIYSRDGELLDEEQLTYLDRVRTAYLTSAELNKERFVVIDATQPLELVVNKVCDRLWPIYKASEVTS